MAATKGKVLAEYAVTVTHNDRHVLVSWDADEQDACSISRGADETAPLGKVQYRALQDGWTSEASAIREAARFLLDTDGCYVEVVPVLDDPFLSSSKARYSMRLRVKD